MGRPRQISLGQALTPRGLGARPGYDPTVHSMRLGQLLVSYGHVTVAKRPDDPGVCIPPKRFV